MDKRLNKSNSESKTIECYEYTSSLNKGPCPNKRLLIFKYNQGDYTANYVNNYGKYLENTHHDAECFEISFTT